MNIVKIDGRRFGKLTVIRRTLSNIRGKARWLCQCDCGNITRFLGTELRNGHVKSCGCYIKESSSKLHKTHGLSQTRLHRIWISMRTRCNNPRSRAYHWYGAVGIRVCKRWDRFENFLIDMQKNYWTHSKKFGEKNTSIDRINPYGNYTPKNCRWATPREQRLSQRKK